MDSITQRADSLLLLLVQFARAMVEGIGVAEDWLRAQLTYCSVTPFVQTILMLGLAALMIIGSIRLLSGLVRFGVVMVIVLIAFHITVAAFQLKA